MGDFFLNSSSASTGCSSNSTSSSVTSGGVSLFIPCGHSNYISWLLSQASKLGGDIYIPFSVYMIFSTERTYPSQQVLRTVVLTTFSGSGYCWWFEPHTSRRMLPRTTCRAEFEVAASGERCGNLWKLTTTLRSQNNAMTITMPSLYSKMAVEVHVECCSGGSTIIIIIRGKFLIWIPNTMFMSLLISGCDTTRPLGIYFRPFANNGHDTKYHKWWACGRLLLGCFWYWDIKNLRFSIRM